MTSNWMFAKAPQVMRPGFVSVPVICQRDAATLIKAAVSEEHRQRVYGEHVLGDVELKGWRWVAAQVFPRPDRSGVFPWELLHD